MNFDEAWDDTCSAVGLACRAGDAAALKHLLEAGRPVDVSDNRGWNPLHEAAEEGHVECSKLFLNREKCHIDALTNNFLSPLMLAARGGHAVVCRLLIDHGSRYECSDDSPECPLRAAVKAGKLDCTRLLVDAGCRIDCKDAEGSTPLHLAFEFERAEVVDLLLECGAAVDAQDGFGKTAVFSAAELPSVHLLRRVLDVAMKKEILAKVLQICTHEGTTPLMIAAQKGSVDCVRLLLEHGADANVIADDYIMALHLSIYGKSVECVGILLDVTDRQKLRSITWQPDCQLVLCPPSSAEDEVGDDDDPAFRRLEPCSCWSCLGGDGTMSPRPRNFDLAQFHSVFHMAVNEKNYDVLQRLLDSDLDPNESLAQDPSCVSGLQWPDDERIRFRYVGVTALASAILLFDNCMVRMLLDGGCRAEPNKDHVAPPLYFAIRLGWMDGVEALLEHGANPNTSLECDTPRCGAFFLRSPTDHDRLLLLLRRAGGDVRYLFVPKRRRIRTSFVHHSNAESMVIAEIQRCKPCDDGLDLVSQLMHSMGWGLHLELRLRNLLELSRSILETYPRLSLKQMSAVVVRNRILDTRPPSAFAASVASLGLPPTLTDFLILKSLS